MNYLNKQVIVRGPCNELTVSGNGYQITIENMVSGKIKLSGFDHELEIHLVRLANSLVPGSRRTGILSGRPAVGGLGRRELPTIPGPLQPDRVAPRDMQDHNRL